MLRLLYTPLFRAGFRLLDEGEMFKVDLD